MTETHWQIIILFHKVIEMSSFIRLFDSILPPRCPFTGEIVDSQGTVSPGAWAELSFITAPHCAACGFPFEFAVPEGGSEALCGSCLNQRPAYDAARAALVYNDASRDLILKFKHGDQTHVVVAMVPWLRAAGAEFWQEADVIVPVPLHRWRLLRRRYNQAALMAGAMGKDRGIASCMDALIRTRATPSQGHLNAGERAKNVKSAFAVNPARMDRIKGKRIILIDDVYTTGSTVEECAKVLNAAGAEKVFVLSLARVVKATRL